MFGYEKVSWLENKKIFGEKKRTGRKRFEIQKNQESSLIDLKDYKSLSPNFRMLYGDLDNSQFLERENKNIRSGVKLRPLEENQYLKALENKEAEIRKLKKLYKETTDKLMIFERKKKSVIVGGGNIRADNFRNNEIMGISPRSRLDDGVRFTKMNPKLVISNPIIG